MCPISRRQMLGEAAGLALGTWVLAGTARADDSLLDPASPAAAKLKYVEDAHQASDAAPDATCANCGLYQGKKGVATGPCQLFPGKAVKAAGWCTSWAPQM
jgi:hypothetical protein